MTCAGQVKIMGGQVEFAFRLPAGQVEFSGLFLSLVGHHSFASFHINLSAAQVPVYLGVFNKKN